MRPTQLNFRPPGERTAEINSVSMTHAGRRTSFTVKSLNVSGSTLPRDVRFKEKSLVDKGTGQTCFLGPGSYNDH